jgi:ComF family protein
MPLAQAEAPCPFCQGKGAAHYEGVVRLGVFDEPLKGMIHQIKYHDRWSMAEYLADRLWMRPAVQSVVSACDAIVPIPLHPLRQIARGYNQAELFARRLARRSGRKLLHAMIRLRSTPTQTHLHSRARRIENLRDAFGLVKPRSITGRRILVVDDVFTTGATLQSAAQALVTAAPLSLHALVIAVADPRHRGFEAV